MKRLNLNDDLSLEQLDELVNLIGICAVMVCVAMIFLALVSQ